MSLLVNPLIDLANFTTVLFSGFMKVPQIYSIFSTGSASGVSLYGLLLEFIGYSLMMSYNFYAGHSVASYFEYPLLFIQDLVLLLLMLRFMKMLTFASLLPFGALALLIFSVGWGYLPTTVIFVLVNLCTPFSASSKVLQLKSILTSKDSTGVSLVSWIISAYTNLARLFTIYVESYDVSLLINFWVSLLLSLSIVLAAKIYQPQAQADKKQD